MTLAHVLTFLLWLVLLVACLAYIEWYKAHS